LPRMGTNCDSPNRNGIMINLTKRSFLVALACGAVMLATSPAFAAKVKTEDELIADLAAPKDGVVADAMLKLERQFPTSPKWQAVVKKMLTDERSKVRRKAGRVLGAVHAEVSGEDLKNIVAMFKAAEPEEAMDALKSLRGLKAESTLPEVVALLKSPHVGIIRDACRTVADLGNKSHVADLEPLLKHADPKVQKDAADAIFKLKAKS
jgi:HEAT repeat protein